VYQIGNFLAAFALQIENLFATKTFPLPNGDADYGKALAVIMLIVFLAVAIITALGKERRGVDFATD
jgi:SHS family lactate transporter-like MFS transporter